jgi:DNA/RNA-binding domain of Phe-tRNA-synthetase-like protein
MRVTIDEMLKAKCPRTALGCVTSRVEALVSAVALIDEMQARVQEILKLPEPRVILESPQITATRAAYKALGKDPARYRGSAEALLRRVIAGKDLPQINAVVDVINLVSIESRLPIGLYDVAQVSGDKTKHVLAVIVSFGGQDGLERWTQRLVELFERYASARQCDAVIAA